MRTLDDARDWYTAAREAAKYLAHLAKYWDQFPWRDGPEWFRDVERDNVLKLVGGQEMGARAMAVRMELDDLAVLLLFSVFEALVREWVRERAAVELDRLKEPHQEIILQKHSEKIDKEIMEGSFGRLLEPYQKSRVPADLVAQVQQVRKYRNWVAHGRREDDKDRALVTPDLAYDRLSRFLKALRGPSVPPLTTP